LPGVKFAGDGERGDAPENILAQSHERGRDGADLLPHRAGWRIDQAKQAVSERRIPLHRFARPAQVERSLLQQAKHFDV
jgi:hypothetical protein